MEKVKLLRHSEITDWIDYVMSHYNSDSYVMGVCKELYYSISPSNSKPLDRNSLRTILLEDIYDNVYSLFPPILDLLLFDSVLLYGQKLANILFKRVVEKCTSTNYLKDTSLGSISSGETTLFNLKELENDLVHTTINYKLANTLWNLTETHKVILCLMIIDEMHNTGNYLLMKRERTVNDITNVIGPRLATHSKYLFTKLLKTKSITDIKKEQMQQLFNDI